MSRVLRSDPNGRAVSRQGHAPSPNTIGELTFPNDLVYPAGEDVTWPKSP